LVDGQPNEKQVGDRGIDGVVRFPAGPNVVGRALVSVKGGEQIAPTMIRDLLGTVQTQKAEIGILILMKEPTKGIKTAAAEGGLCEIKALGKGFPKIQVLTVQQLLDGKRANMPTPFLPYVKARRHAPDQLKLLT
jgi:hypothetical protein